MENIIRRIVSDGNMCSMFVNTKFHVNIGSMIALRVSPAETQVDGLPPASSLEYMTSIISLGGNPN